MKEQAILKINKIGKIGCILTTIMKVFLIIALVGTIIGTIVMAILPDNLFSINYSGDAEVAVSLEAVSELTNHSVTPVELTQGIEQAMNDGDISIDGKDYANVSIDVKNGLMVVGMEAENPASVNGATIRNILIMVVIYLAILLATVYLAGFLCKALRTCESPFEENVITKMKHLNYTLIPLAVFDSVRDNAINALSGKSDSFVIGVNTGLVLVVLVVIALTVIFKYGAALQQESDETL